MLRGVIGMIFEVRKAAIAPVEPMV